MSEVVYRRFLQVTIPDPDARNPSELERLEATPRNGHFGKSWNVGSECSANYVVIYEDDIDSWIELLQEMKRVGIEDLPVAEPGSTETIEGEDA